MTDPQIPDAAVKAATKAVRTATLKVPCPEDREIAESVLAAALPHLDYLRGYIEGKSAGRAVERNRTRQAAEAQKEVLIRPADMSLTDAISWANFLAALDGEL